MCNCGCCRVFQFLLLVCLDEMKPLNILLELDRGRPVIQVILDADFVYYICKLGTNVGRIG